MASHIIQYETQNDISESYSTRRREQRMGGKPAASAPSDTCSGDDGGSSCVCGRSSAAAREWRHADVTVTGALPLARAPAVRPASPAADVPRSRPYMGQRRASFIKRRYTSPRATVWAVRSFSVYGRRIRHTRRARLQFNKSTGASITCVCVVPCAWVYIIVSTTIRRVCVCVCVYLRAYDHNKQYTFESVPRAVCEKL